MDHAVVWLRGLLRQACWTNMSHLFPTTWMGSFIFPCHTAGGVLGSCGILTFHVLHEQHRSSQLKTSGSEARVEAVSRQSSGFVLDGFNWHDFTNVDLCKIHAKSGEADLSYFKILEITCCDKSEGFRNMQRITISITAWECANARFLYTVILRWQVAPWAA